MLTSIKFIALYGLYVLAIVMFLLSLTGKVKYSLYFMVLLVPLQNIMVKLYDFPFGKDLNDILLISMLVGWVVQKGLNGERFFEKSNYNLILFLYLIFTYITLWHGSSFLGFPAPISVLDTRVQTWKNYMIFPLLFLITLNTVRDKKELAVLLGVMCASMFVMNYYTIIQISWITAWWNRTKIDGTFVWLGPNEVAAFYATYTLVILGILLFIKEKVPKLLLCTLVFLNFYCDLFLFSRGAYLATLIGLLLISVTCAKKLIIPLLLVLIFWNTVLPVQVVERIEFTEQSGQLDVSAASRLTFWEQSIEFFKASPIIGIGFNTFHHLGLKRDAHNIYLRTLAEQGLIGLWFLLLIFFVAFKRSWRLYRRANDRFLKGLGLGFCACILAVMVGNFFGDRWTYLPLGAYFWIFLGIVERGNVLVDSEQEVIRDNKTQRSIGNESEYEPKINNKITLAEALKGGATKRNY